MEMASPAEKEKEKEEVHTLFVSGLPNDVKEREIHNLFRSYPGYQDCHLNFTGRGYQMVAFVVFTDKASALSAKDALNGHIFDPELGSTLTIELARANSRVKRPHSDERGPSASEKRIRGPQGFPALYPKAAATGMVHSVYSDLSGFPPSQSGMLGNYAMQDGSGIMMGSLTPPPPAPGSNLPCPTLFVSNLGQRCTEEELNQVFGRFAGFRKLKMQMRGGLPMAFVEYKDVACSTQVLNQLQNAVLPSSDYSVISVESEDSIQFNGFQLRIPICIPLDNSDCIIPFGPIILSGPTWTLRKDLAELLRYAKSRMGQPGRDRQRQLSAIGYSSS